LVIITFCLHISARVNPAL